MKTIAYTLNLSDEYRAEYIAHEIYYYNNDGMRFDVTCEENN